MTPEEVQQIVDATNGVTAQLEAVAYQLDAIVWTTGITAGGVWMLIFARALIARRPIA